MKIDALNNATKNYIAGWDVALHNYDVFEIESINQLVNSSKDMIQSQSASIGKEGTDYFPLALMNSHWHNF